MSPKPGLNFQMNSSSIFSSFSSWKCSQQTSWQGDGKDTWLAPKKLVLLLDNIRVAFSLVVSIIWKDNGDYVLNIDSICPSSYWTLKLCGCKVLNSMMFTLRMLHLKHFPFCFDRYGRGSIIIQVNQLLAIANVRQEFRIGYSRINQEVICILPCAGTGSNSISVGSFVSSSDQRISRFIDWLRINSLDCLLCR